LEDKSFDIQQQNSQTRDSHKALRTSYKIVKVSSEAG